MPGLLDLVLCAAIVVLAPIGAVSDHRRLARAVAAGDPYARLDAYARGIAFQWAVSTGLLAMVVARGIPLRVLGLERPSGRGFAIACVIGTAITLLLLAQMRAALTRPELADQVRQAAASLRNLLPATPAEMRRFTWVGITAGIVEELVFRGYFVWSLSLVAPAWVAIIVSAVAFGIGHAYQGPAGILKTGLAGLVFGGLYLLAGSIWVPMFVHAALDVIQGGVVYGVMARPVGGETPRAP
jgi:membrane protease YdiL (CAAX protease family)